MNKLNEILILMSFYRNYKTFINGVLANDDDFLRLVAEIVKNNLQYQTNCDGRTFEIEIEKY